MKINLLDIYQKEFNVRFSDILEKHLKGLNILSRGEVVDMDEVR